MNPSDTHLLWWTKCRYTSTQTRKEMKCCYQTDNKNRGDTNPEENQDHIHHRSIHRRNFDSHSLDEDQWSCRKIQDYKAQVTRFQSRSRIPGGTLWAALSFEDNTHQRHIKSNLPRMHHRNLGGNIVRDKQFAEVQWTPQGSNIQGHTCQCMLQNQIWCKSRLE